MKIRTSNITRQKAQALKVKCWKILARKAIEEEDPVSCSLIIDLAENSYEEEPEGELV